MSFEKNKLELESEERCSTIWVPREEKNSLAESDEEIKFEPRRCSTLPSPRNEEQENISPSESDDKLELKLFEQKRCTTFMIPRSEENEFDPKNEKK